MKRALALTLLVGLLACGAATAATPAQYRTHLNAICRSYTPKLKQLGNAMTKAQQANDPKAYGIALGKSLVLVLAQDLQLEHVAVPAPLRAQMAPILTSLKKIDAHVRTALAAAKAGNSNKVFAEVSAIQPLIPPLNAKLDAAGLRDCGSNQQ
jgi:predicted ATP-grasp superfamily ATP-dependent carboligase